MRFVVLDTETTGLNKKGSVSKGHRVIEIGCVEIVDGCLTGKEFHVYLDPERRVSRGALKLHGVTDAFLKGKPKFKDIVGDLLAFIGDSELVIHNASFDTQFMDMEFEMLPEDLQPKRRFIVNDTLSKAREIFPGQRNTLEALAMRFGLGIQKDKFHSALIDARVLASVFLHITDKI